MYRRVVYVALVHVIHISVWALCAKFLAALTIWLPSFKVCSRVILWRSRNVAPLSAEFVQCVRGGLRSMSFAGDLGIKQLRETQQKKSRRLYVVREVHAKY